jgi:DNA replication protein DnaC
MYNQILDQLESKAADRIKEEPGDYIQDGLLYCGKCRTQKQVRITFAGRERTPMCLCQCAAERLEKEEAERREQRRKERIEQIRKEAFPDASLINATFENSVDANETGMTVARNYVDKFPEFLKAGRGLIFFGTVGTGKTYLAACIANALIDKGYTALVTNFSRIVNTIQGMYEGKQEYLDSLNEYDLLVLDDFAAERDTEYMNEQVYNILDNRLRSGLPLILTTNLTASELKEPSGITRQRLHSRIYEMCFPVEIVGKDRRRKDLSQNYARYKEMLGL